MTDRAIDALLDLLNEKNQEIARLELLLLEHDIPPLPAPTPEGTPQP